MDVGKKRIQVLSTVWHIYTKYKQEHPKVKGKKELVNKYYFGGLYRESKGVQEFWGEIQRYIEQNYDSEELQQVFISGDGGN